MQKDKVLKPRWAIDVEVVLFKIGLPKRELARLIGVNYSHMVCVLSGSRISPTIQAKILSKVAELESEVS